MRLRKDSAKSATLSAECTDWFSIDWITVSWFFERWATSRMRKRISPSALVRDAAALARAAETVSTSAIICGRGSMRSPAPRRRAS
ncbi:hypothetical protein D3C87_1883400 [compost metagenome]